MKMLPLISFLLVFNLIGCAYSPLTEDMPTDYYIPQITEKFQTSKITKKVVISSTIGLATGAYIGSQIGNGVLIPAIAIGGLIIGHEFGRHLDKTDYIHNAMLLEKTLNQNLDGQISTFKNPAKDMTITSIPYKLRNYNIDNCREFITTIKVKDKSRQMRGIACKIREEWYLKEIY